MQGKTMELAIFWASIIGALLLGSFAVTAWSMGHKVAAIWWGYGGVCTFLLVVALQWTAILKNSEGTTTEVTQADPAHIVITQMLIKNINNDQVPTAYVGFKNVGQSPAYDVRGSFNISLRPADETTFSDAEISDGATKGTMGPGVEWGSTFAAERPLVEEARKALMDGVAKLYVFGKIIYTDALKRSRTTNFRGYLDPRVGIRDGVLTGSPEGNETD